MGTQATATLIIEYSPPIPMTVANATGIERGAMLTLSDPLTAAACTDSRTACAGVLGEEKIALDAKTKAPVYRDGVFRVTCSSAEDITVGQACQACSISQVEGLSLEASDVHQWFIALETATDGDEFLAELKPGHHPVGA